MRRPFILAGILALLTPTVLAAQDSPPAPPRTQGDSQSFPQPRMEEGQPFDTRPPEKADDKPLFPQQTRAPYHKVAGYNVTTITDKLHLPWSIAFLPDGKMLVTEKFPAHLRIVSPAVDAAQFDSEALWERLRSRDWNGARVLVVRGDGGRDWLADRLRDAGATVATVGAYRRIAPTFAADARARLGALVAGDVREIDDRLRAAEQPDDVVAGDERTESRTPSATRTGSRHARWRRIRASRRALARSGSVPSSSAARRSMR